VAELALEYQRRLLATIQTIAVRFGVETEPTWETLRRDVLGQINFQQVIGTTVASVSSIVATFTVVLIYAGFLLMERGAFAQKVSRLSDDPARVAHIRRLIGDINSRIGTYLVMKTGINVLLGSLSYIVMRFAGIEFAGFWALLIGLFNYIPYVGSFLGVFFPVAHSVLQFGALGPVILIALALSATQVLVGNFIEPWLMGTSLNLSPFVILVSLVTWSSLWGLAGAILAVPITAILVIVLSEFPGTRPIAVLLSKDGTIPPVGDHAEA
jgi:predicted PurR-regulated permease PerM